MQLRAYNEKDLVIFAHQAKKQSDYFCLECRGVVRLRSGVHRQKHFFHLSPSQDCRQSGKSMEHLQAQFYLKQLLGEECVLEYSFPSIHRIADCAWISKKIIFEIQCSSISQEEVIRRNEDYASMGYRVVWILHDRRFNQRRLSAAELWLQEHPHYFTNMDMQGKGHFYDQLDAVGKGVRRVLLKPAVVDVSKPVMHDYLGLPAVLIKRHEQWQLSFEGDWMHRAVYGECVQNVLREDEDKGKRVINVLRWVWRYCISIPYRVVFSYMLEKACR